MGPHFYAISVVNEFKNEVILVRMEEMSLGLLLLTGR